MVEQAMIIKECCLLRTVHLLLQHSFQIEEALCLFDAYQL
jgi:hypothetical protein